MAWMFRLKLLATACFALLASGCRSPDDAPQLPAPSASVAPQSSAAAAATARAEQNVACDKKRRSLDAAPALPGAPGLESQRALLLARAKGSPVVFTRPPQRDLNGLPPFLRPLIPRLDDPGQVLVVLRTLRTWLPNHMPMVRAALMPEGYFYAETPDAAEWMELLFKLEHLFSEKELWLLRGSEIQRLTRSELGYRFAEGPDKGREASLLMFDRVALTREELAPALHVDLVPASREHGFDRIKVERFTADGVNVQLRYGSDEVWTRGVLSLDGPRAKLSCEIVDDAIATRVSAFRAEAGRRERLLEKIRTTVSQQVDENLPFDEPREEVGQQDGSLRPQWLWAYNHGSDYYSFNKISYQVFDSKGRPRPPQVCIDFVLDSYERASGTWFRGKGEERGRVSGGLDFEQAQMPNRRGVESVVNYFRQHPDMFDVWDLPAEERIRYRDRQTFLAYLLAHADQFRPPDVVVIHGPKGAENHYHSFFVYESDPVTGMPILLAGNAGKPRVRPWSAVMLSAPMRSIKHRLRPNQAWLEQVMTDGATARPVVTAGVADASSDALGASGTLQK